MMRYLVPVCLLVLGFAPSVARAHFPFVLPDEGNATARVIMSETLQPDDEVDVGLLSGMQLTVRAADGAETPMVLARAKNWMSAAIPGEGARTISGSADLGIHQRGSGPAHVLVYYPKALLGDAFKPATKPDARLPVELIPERLDEAVRLLLVANGKPLPNAPVRVVTPGGEEIELTTNLEGWTPPLRESGRYGAWARHWITEPGERDGRQYEQVRQYATLVFDLDSPSTAPPSPPTTSATVSPFTPLFRPLASFGAVECDGWLYVYGGHSATRHEYSTASVSGRLARLNLTDPTEWEQLSGGVPVQGMNLAAHGRKIYRVGGMEPRNAPGLPADNHSIAEAAAFDPLQRRWTSLPPLPAPRSSHDVVVVGDTLLVVGGWSMGGRNETTTWLDTIELLDLSSAGSTWESVPAPFSRRALTAAAVGDSVFIMGGFNATDEALLDVDIFHFSTRTWSKGPPIPGSARNGFGPAACVHDGTLYLSVGTGELYRLRKDWTAWELTARTTPRIVHRLVPSNGAILAIGGAADAQMLDLIEIVSLDGSTRAALPVMPLIAARPDPSTHAGGGFMSQSMIEISDISRNLELLEGAGWKMPGGHAHVDPAAEVARMADLLRGLASMDTGNERDADLAARMTSSEEQVRALHQLLAAKEPDVAGLSKQFKLVMDSCTACHRVHRH